VALDDKAQIDSLVINLTREFGDHVGEEAIRREVTGVYGRFS